MSAFSERDVGRVSERTIVGLNLCSLNTFTSHSTGYTRRCCYII